MNFWKVIYFVFCVNIVLAQNSEIESSDLQFNSKKKHVSFSHQPFLLLKITPTALFGYNNVIQYGAEIAPPFGKFSFGFDYGTGKGKRNFNKIIRKQLPDSKNTIIRGELRMYFSDWYPFYSLDKKPFGRYYALEYVNGKYERNRQVANIQGGNTENSVFKFTEKTQALNFKVGKHIHLNKFIFIDISAGLGIGKYKAEVPEDEINIENIVPLKVKYFGKNAIHNPDSKGMFFSKTVGVRLALVI